MYCSKCGAFNSDDDFFCTQCGSRLNQPESARSDPAPQPVVVNVVNQTAASAPYPYKSKWTAFFLCFFFGFLGIHRFYVGKNGTGLLWMFTFGFFGLGALVDFFSILFGSFRDKEGYPLR